MGWGCVAADIADELGRYAKVVPYGLQTPAALGTDKEPPMPRGIY